VSGQLHAPAALPLEKAPQYPLERRLGGPQNWYGCRGEEKVLDPTGTQTLTPRHIAYSQLLYRLRYPSSCCFSILDRCLIELVIYKYGGWQCSSHTLHGWLVNIHMYFNQTSMAKSCRRKYPIKCFSERCLDVGVLNICYNYPQIHSQMVKLAFYTLQLSPEDQPTWRCSLLSQLHYHISSWTSSCSRFSKSFMYALVMGLQSLTEWDEFILKGLLVQLQ
jgi:hypothetical protein